MADKKVDRNRREHPPTPTQKMSASISDEGTMNMADLTHDKGKSALADKFRQREERWRREQALHEEEVARAAASDRQADVHAEERAKTEGRGEGGTP
jgi:hypothetical protein